ncbi:hypothetical protein VPH35_075369 [Triticum aestivum]
MKWDQISSVFTHDQKECQWQGGFENPINMAHNFEKNGSTMHKMTLLMVLQTISKQMTWSQGLYLMTCYTFRGFSEPQYWRKIIWVRYGAAFLVYQLFCNSSVPFNLVYLQL